MHCGSGLMRCLRDLKASGLHLVLRARVTRFRALGDARVLGDTTHRRWAGSVAPCSCPDLGARCPAKGRCIPGTAHVIGEAGQRGCTAGMGVTRETCCRSQSRQLPPVAGDDRAPQKRLGGSSATWGLWPRGKAWSSGDVQSALLQDELRTASGMAKIVGSIPAGP